MARLTMLQKKHQRAYKAAHGLGAIKPKHHHRLHIPQGAVLFGALPSTEATASKQHQRELLPRLLDETVRAEDTHSLSTWRAGPQVDHAPEWLQALLGDRTLAVVHALVLSRSIIAGDVVLRTDITSAGLVSMCLCGERAGLRLVIKEMKKKIPPRSMG